MFRGFLANLIQWILLLNEFICNKYDLEDRNRKISDVRWTKQWNKKWFDSGIYITLETNLASFFICNVCRMMSSDILTSAQHWIEEPSEIIGEETAVQFPYFGLGINYRGVMDQEILGPLRWRFFLTLMFYGNHFVTENVKSQKFARYYCSASTIEVNK